MITTAADMATNGKTGDDAGVQKGNKLNSASRRTNTAEDDRVGEQDEHGVVNKQVSLGSSNKAKFIGAMRRGCHTYQAMQRLQGETLGSTNSVCTTQQYQLTNELIHSVMTQRDHAYSLPSPTHSHDDGDFSENRVTDSCSEDSPVDGSNPMAGIETVISGDDVSLEIPYLGTDDLDELPTDSGIDGVDTVESCEDQSEEGIGNGKTSPTPVNDGTWSDSEDEISFKLPDSVAKLAELDTDEEVPHRSKHLDADSVVTDAEPDSHGETNGSNNGDEGERSEDNLSLFLESSPDDSDEEMEEATDNESVSSARFRVLGKNRVPRSPERNARTKTPPQAATPTSAQEPSTETGRKSPASTVVLPLNSGEDASKMRKRPTSDTSTNPMKRSRTENTDEQCILLAVADAFRRFSREQTCTAKQEILRILCTIEFNRSAPSANIFHIESLLTPRNLADKPSQIGN